MEGSNLVAPNLDYVRGRVEEAKKAAGSDVTLVAVSKLMEVPVLMEAYNHHQRHFGENYVQEICDKAPQMPSDVLWHFIGHLQSNKAKQLIKHVPNLYIVESVDSAKTASALDKAVSGVTRAEKLRVMIQVNTSSEEAKSGVSTEEAPELIHHVLAHCPNLNFVGLMTIGKLGDPNPGPYFQALADCRDDVVHKLSLKKEEVSLSMGMSSDFEEAISCGSTNVRVGSTIFGARPAKDQVSIRKRESSSVSVLRESSMPFIIPENKEAEGCRHVYKVTWCSECCPPNPHAFSPVSAGTPFGPGGSEVRPIKVWRVDRPADSADSGEGVMGFALVGVAAAVIFAFWKSR